MGNILAFVGSSPNIGTTLAAFGTAVGLARETRHSVGYLCLNLKSSKIHRYLGLEEADVTLDGIRAELKSQSLHKERLLQYCMKPKGAFHLHVLFGNMQREQAEYFTPNEIGHLLEVARKAFDVCIIDLNAYWDNAATICGLMGADAKLLVTTSQIVHFQEDMNRWFKSLSPLMKMDSSQFSCIVTQVSKETSNGIKPSDVAKELGMEVRTVLHYEAKVQQLLNQGKLMDLYVPDSPFFSELKPLVTPVMEQFQLATKLPAPKKRWIHRMVSAATFSGLS